MNTFLKRIFKKGYNKKISVHNIKEEVIQLLFYMLRWQLSTPILAIVTIWLASLNNWISVIIANLIGSLIFYWVDKFIFKP